MVSAGSMTSMARKRGTTRYAGLIAMTSRASISSETFIVPSSAATAEPLRPITITAIKHRAHFAKQGDHDKVRDIHFGPELLKRMRGLHGQGHPHAKSGQGHHGRGPDADEDHLPENGARS